MSATLIKDLDPSEEQASARMAQAIQNKDDDALARQLAAGADPDSVSFYQPPGKWRSALGAAVEIGSLKAIGLLLSSGADPEGVAGFASAKWAGIKAPAPERSLYVCGSSSLFLENALEAMERAEALLFAGASAQGGWDGLIKDIWERGEALAPLFKALARGGASVEALSEEGYSALWLAVSAEALELTRALIALGADPDRVGSGFNHQAQTPLELAHERGLDIADELTAASERCKLGAMLQRGAASVSSSRAI